MRVINTKWEALFRTTTASQADTAKALLQNWRAVLKGKHICKRGCQKDYPARDSHAVAVLPVPSREALSTTLPLCLTMAHHRSKAVKASSTDGSQPSLAISLPPVLPDTAKPLAPPILVQYRNVVWKPRSNSIPRPLPSFDAVCAQAERGVRA